MLQETTIEADKESGQFQIDKAIVESDENKQTVIVKGISEPAPIGSAAKTGLIGDILKEIDGKTEASAESLIGTLVAGLGNCIGRGPHSYAGGPRHGVNEFIALIGPSSRGAKGQAQAQEDYLMGGTVDDEDRPQSDVFWEGIDRKAWSSIVKRQLGSGQGLISVVRDTVDEEGVPTATGKNALFVEEEWSGIFQSMNMSGSTMSQTLRMAWEGRNLEQTVKGEPLKATNPHVSMAAHITTLEFADMMRRHSISIANGLLNRYVFFWSLRSRRLPKANKMPDWEPFKIDIRERLYRASLVGRLERSAKAEDIWDAMYDDLTPEDDGLLSSMTARNRAHALRLQILYAALAGHKQIEENDVMAAMAIVNYSIDSLRFLLQTQTGNEIAEKIIRAFRENKFMNRTYINKVVLGGNKLTEEIDEAYRMLERNGLIKPVETYTIGSRTFDHGGYVIGDPLGSLDS